MDSVYYKHNLLSNHKCYSKDSEQEIFDNPVACNKYYADYNETITEMQPLYTAAAYETKGLAYIKNKSDSHRVWYKRIVNDALDYVTVNQINKRPCATAAGTVKARHLPKDTVA